jgi:hypothetical protein
MQFDLHLHLCAFRFYLWISFPQTILELMFSLRLSSTVNNCVSKTAEKNIYQISYMYIHVASAELIVIFRHAQKFFSYMMAHSFYWRKREPRYIIQCIWGETTDLPQVNWQSSSHSRSIRTDAGWRWEVLWYWDRCLNHSATETSCRKREEC